MLTGEPVYLIFSQEAQNVPEWKEYGEYCLLRDKGLRKQAFQHLNIFLRQSASWTFEETKRFVLWLYKKNFLNYHINGLCPEPLKNELMEPFFEKWIAMEPRNTEPLVLLAKQSSKPGLYDKIIAIDPNNQFARTAMADDCIGDIWFSTHHLPHYFIGDPDEVRESARKATEHISYLEAGDQKERLIKELRNSEQLLQDWIDFNAEGGNDFDLWCKERGRRYAWLKAYYYDK